MTESGPTASPPKDPQPAVERVDSLARRILAGDILLPKFQRDFVWERGQILDLLDSVFRNYPIGSVLLWQSRQELRSENDIAGLEISLPKPDYPVNYLLDGQQRLSVICGALYWQGKEPTSLWNIAFDLRKQEFRHLQDFEDLPPHLIRTNRLADPSSFYKQVSTIETLDLPDKGQLKESADLLFNRFKDYFIAVVTLGDMAIDDVAPIFERINSTGTPLTIVDLMRAATWSSDFDLIDSIDDIRETLDEKNFGGVDRKVILRNLSAAAGGGFSAESIDDLRTHDADALKEASSITEASFRRSVDFLTTEIGAPSDSIIPYANQLVVLTEVFRRLASPTAEQYQQVYQWFWRTAVSGYFSGWNTGMMATDLAAAVDFTSGKTDELIVDAVLPNPEIWRSRQYRSNGAHAKSLGIILSHLNPVDLLTGNKIDTSKSLFWANAKEYHHFFPRDYLKNKGVPAKAANCLANLVLLTSVSNKTISNRAPSDYLKEVQKAAGDNLESWLSSNLISMEAFEAALEDDFTKFTSIRCRDINSKAAQLAGWQ